MTLPRRQMLGIILLYSFPFSSNFPWLGSTRIAYPPCNHTIRTMVRYFACSVRDFRKSPDYSDHRLNWEFWITFEGRVKPRFHDRPKLDVPEANLWIMPPGLRYRWVAATRRIRRAVVHFAYVPEEIEAATRRNQYFSRLLGADELREAELIAATLGAAYMRRDTLSRLFFHRALIDLALLALRHEPTRPVITIETQGAARADAALRWFIDHANEAPKLERIAAAVNLSVSHLRRLFHASFNCNPKVVLDRVRLQKAANLLSSSTDTLDTIAAASGFRDATELCRFFRRHFKSSPDMWRRTVGVVKPDLIPTGQKARRQESPRRRRLQ